MFETVKKADQQPGEKNGYDLRRAGKEIQKKSRPLRDDIRVNTKIVQRQSVQNQTVIQMAPYEDFLDGLQRADRVELADLCEALTQYINSRRAYEEERRGQDSNRKKALASLLNAAFEISKKANAIKMGLTDDDAELKVLLTSLGKFVHVELLSDETMSLDDLSDILEQTRALAETQAGSSSESPVKGKDIIRELGLLSVMDSEEQQKMVLMINGGGSLEGTRGSVTAPGEDTPVFKNNWRDVKFIAHTHPNESELQTDVEFKTDVEAARKEGLKRAEMVHRDQITGGIGGTIFYTGKKVLSRKNNERYIEGFAVRVDNLNEILDAYIKDFKIKHPPEQSNQYEEFVQKFIDDIRERIVIRDQIADVLKRETLSVAGFLEFEQQLARLSTEHPEIFDAEELRSKFCWEYWKKFPKPKVQEEENLDDLFSMLEGGILNVEKEEEG